MCISESALQEILRQTKRINSVLQILGPLEKGRDSHTSNNAQSCDRLIKMNFKHLQVESAGIVLTFIQTVWKNIVPGVTLNQFIYL